MSISGGSISWTGLNDDTSTSGSWTVYVHDQRCASDGRHTIRFRHARGSNGHVRRETGECIYCGKVYHRLIRWNEKRADWWEPLDDEAA